MKKWMESIRQMPAVDKWLYVSGLAALLIAIVFVVLGLCFSSITAFQWAALLVTIVAVFLQGLRLLVSKIHKSIPIGIFSIAVAAFGVVVAVLIAVA